MRTLPLLSTLLALGLLAPLAAPSLRAQATELPRKEFTSKTTESFDDLRKFTEAQDFPRSLQLIDSLLVEAPAGSYDRYVLSQIKGQILLSLNRLGDAIAPFETCIAMAEANPNFLEPKSRLDQLNLLAQIVYQQGSESKDPAVQRAGYERALGYMERWFRFSDKPGVQQRLFAASIHYNLASAGGAAKPDETQLKSALAQLEEGLLLTTRPTAQLRNLYIACLIQLGDLATAADHLEVVVEADPKTSATWSQLSALYLNLAGEAKDPAIARSYNLRALHAIERAQSHGHLKSPRENYTRVAILFNLSQYGVAADLIEAGIANQSIESSRRNWELLAAAYQQSNRETKALDTLSRAVGLFPTEPDLEFALAQNLYGAGRAADAYARAEAAVAKPGLAKPGQARLYLAFIGYELQRYDEAQKWVDAARAGGDVPAASLDPIAKAVAEAIKAREALKNS